MGGSKKQKDKSFENRILIPVQSVITIWEVVCIVVSIKSGDELPWLAFLVIQMCAVGFLFIVLILETNDVIERVKSYKAKKKALDEAADGHAKKQKKYGYEVAKLRKKFWKKIKKVLKPRMISCGFAMIVIVFLCWCNPQNTQAVKNMMSSVVNIGVEKEEYVETEGEDKNEHENLGLSTEKNAEEETTVKVSAPKPKEYRFVIDEPEKNYELEEVVENKVFFYKGKQEIDLEKQFIWRFDAILACKRSGTDLGEIVDDEGNGYSVYEEKEYQFKKEVEQVKDFKLWDEWIQAAPHSNRLEEYIEGRIKLNSIVVNGNCGNYKLWWRLANDYQYYAQEYESQTQNQQAILYYYSMSIYSCMEALEYDMPVEEYEKIFNYMEKRYQDMCRDEALVPVRYKLRAQAILGKVQEYEAFQR